MAYSERIWYQATVLTEHGTRKFPMRASRELSQRDIDKYKYNYQGDFVSNEQIILCKEILVDLDFDDDGTPLPTYGKVPVDFRTSSEKYYDDEGPINLMKEWHDGD